jgi:hypothetical protein
MGCGLSHNFQKIQKATAIEIIPETDYNPSIQNLKTLTFLCQGKNLCLHYKPFC